MRIAIIDCGTNTFNLLVGTVTPEGIHLDFKTKIPVKLGSGGLAEGKIGKEPFERGIEALKSYRRVLDKMRMKSVYCFGTSALRSAANGETFVETAERLTKIHINLISGEEEADLIYQGVKNGIQIDRPSVVMDIGGGSTEFIIADEKEVKWKYSYDLGAARLLELVKPDDIITPKQINTTYETLSQYLTPLFDAMEKHEALTLIGSSGSFDTLASMMHHRFGLPLNFSSRTFDFPIKHTQETLNALIASSYSERLNMPGMIEMRADMMVMSALFIKFILEKGKMKHMKLSTYALKEGAFYEISKNPEKWRKSSL